MSIASVITGGFGPPGSASLVITDGFATAGATPPPAATTTPGGVRRSRFLRRGPRLPGYDPEPEQPAVVVREQHRRKRVRAPLIEHPALPDLAVPPIPQTVPIATRLYVPELGTAILAEIDDEEEAILMALLQ